MREHRGVRAARAVLALSALPFLGIGAAFLCRPAAMAARVGIALQGPTADADIRAVYGGLQIGVGVFLVLCARRRDWLAAGLSAQVLAFAGLLAARGIGALAAGLPTPLGVGLAAAEVAGALAGAAALFALRRAGR